MFLRLSQGCWPVGWPLRPVPPGAAGVPSKVSEALGADSRVPGWLATGTQVLLEPVWSSVTVCPVAGVPEACFLAGSTGWSPTPSFTQQLPWDLTVGPAQGWGNSSRKPWEVPAFRKPHSRCAGQALEEAS